MDVDEASVIHGLELSARCMTNQIAETNATRFFIGTQSLRQENQLHFVEFDEDNNLLDKIIFSHDCGEVWHLSASFDDKDVIATCYSDISSQKDLMECSIWRIPVSSPTETNKETFNTSTTPHQPLQKIADISTTDDFGSVISTHWKPVEESHSLALLAGNHLLLYDLNESRPMLSDQYKLPDKKGHPCPVTSGRWNPHHNGKHFAVTSEQNVIGIDIRSKEHAYLIECAHFQGTRDLDFNPNKMYDLVTSGEDCAIRFWDIRNLNDPIKVVADEHSHWVWSVRYNPFHDQLLLSAGSDSSVVLHCQSSISSEPNGTSELSDSDNDSNESYEGSKLVDGVIAKYEEHEDSVYAVEWSCTDPWTFASLSYDGRLVVNKVPKTIKFDILL